MTLLAMTSACRLTAHLIEDDTDLVDAGLTPVDARPELEFDANPDCQAWPVPPTQIDVCKAPAGDGLTLTPGQWFFDTNSGALTDPNSDASFPQSTLVTDSRGIELRIVSLEHFTVDAGATLRAEGKRPLVLVSWTLATIAGVIDVSSNAGDPGAGSTAGGCVSASDGADEASGAGGGAGGALGGAGGDGGDGNNVATTAAGGTGADAVSPMFVLGGCPGAAGGNNTGGAGGNGGGAIAVIARDAIEVTGTIHAGGAGGGAAQGGKGGGGGGGSGGGIDLQAPSIVLGADAIVAANGGAGGGGSDNNDASQGQAGQLSDLAALGGAGEGKGKPGGNGGAGTPSGGPGVASERGGGGGGGGAGFIFLRTDSASLSTAVVSPAQQP